MNSPQHVDTLFLFENGSINTVINDNHGNIYTNGTEHHLKPKPAPKADAPTPSGQADRLSSLITYLQPLSKYANPQLTLPVADALTQLLTDSDIAAWLFSGKGQEGGINKTKVFKLARLLRVRHFYLDTFTDNDLNFLLEKSASDTNYRKNMNKDFRIDHQVEARIKSIVEPLIKKM